jgi:hypothetical protein
MESMMKLPDDMFKQEMLPYLTVYDIVKLDSACMNHKYRSHLLNKIDGVILIGDTNKSMKDSLFKWLQMRRIFFVNMLIEVTDLYLHPALTEHEDQFRYTQHVVMRGPIQDDMAIFIISHCPCLVSIVISESHNNPQVTDHTLLSIAQH